jgi:hypothetical protein
MKSMLLAGLALLAGCGSSSPSLDGTWVYNASQTQGAGVIFNADGTYVGQELVITNIVTDSSGNPISVSANDQEESGTYTDNGTSVSFSPTMNTCPGADPPYTLSYSFSNGQLVVSSPGHVETLMRNVNESTSTTYSITTGCFASDGTFTAYPPMGVN